MEKMIMASRMTALKCLVLLSQSRSSFASVVLQKSKKLVLLSRYQHSLSHRVISRFIDSEYYSIGKPLEATIQLKRKLTTAKSAETMSTVFYEEIKDLPNHPEKTLIDVREPTELEQTGVIPTSINIPLGAISNELVLSDEQFKKKYGRTKPSHTSEIIFSCRSGMRAGKAAVAAADLSYENVKIYKGSWTDWAEHEGLH